MAVINKVAMKKAPRLDLSGARLSTFPEPLVNIVQSGLLPGIKELELSKNGIQEVPDAIDSFESLEELSLSHNRIRSLPSGLPHLSHTLHSLHLDHNELEAFPEALCGLGQLRQLALHYNRIASIPAAVASLQSLRLLNVAANRLTELPADLFFIPGLAFVQASGNRIRSLPDSISSCASLCKLAVADNPELRHLPSAIGECRLLQELNCAGTAVAELPLSLADLPELRSLNLTAPTIVSREAQAGGPSGIIKYLDMLQRFDVKKFDSQGHWQPDESAPKCKVCSSDFGLFKRRHHCRLCGIVLCKECLVGVFSHPRLDGILSKSKVCGECERQARVHNGAPPRPQAAPQKAGGGTTAVAAAMPLPRHGLTGAEKALPPQEQLVLLSAQREEFEALLTKERRALAGTEKLISFYQSDPAAQAVAQRELNALRERVQQIEVALSAIHANLSSVTPPGAQSNVYVPPVVGKPSAAGRRQPLATKGTSTPKKTLRGRGRRGTAVTPSSGAVTNVSSPKASAPPPPLPPRDTEEEDNDEEEENLEERPLPPIPLQESEPEAEKAEVTYAFVAESPNELTVAAGERISVVERAGAWWFVENAQGRIGAVPCSYLRLI